MGLQPQGTLRSLWVQCSPRPPCSQQRGWSQGGPPRVFLPHLGGAEERASLPQVLSQGCRMPPAIHSLPKVWSPAIKTPAPCLSSPPAPGGPSDLSHAGWQPLPTILPSPPTLAQAVPLPGTASSCSISEGLVPAGPLRLSLDTTSTRQPS